MADLRHFNENISEHHAERISWMEKRDLQRAKHQATIEEIENEKVMEIEHLRKQMLLQIRAVKVNMLNLNED